MSDANNYMTHRGLRLDVAVSSVIAFTGVTFSVLGIVQYGVWENNGPGPGFFPAFSGALATITATLAAFRKHRQESARLSWKEFSPLAAAISSGLMVSVIGMTAAMTLFVLAWIRLVEKRSWRSAFIASAVTFTLVNILFAQWLGVQFPDSLLNTILPSGS
ncbi:hypothetical protein TH47_17850 [Thalassospira sp. MCCC 1A02803]|nr:hypothetical protein AUQ41_09850 [Thalassospira sp. MCCC 1A02898]ONH86097.1 hypothetical protein TH47_17850 [Thalassospira sp. MCCC 1A02803]